MSRRTLTSNAFHSALDGLRSTVSERRAQRLTPPAPPPPRDSDPQAGEALPEHTRDADSERVATLPTGASAWAWAETDSDDGASRR